MKVTGAQRQAEMQQKIVQMQEAMAAAQEAVEAQTFSASVGGGVVEAKVSGKKEVVSIAIKPEAVDPEDVEMLQDLVVSAVNEALRQADEAMEAGMNGVTGGLNLGGFGL
nr:YbaB/EbfC family nucleoid-associated protein [Oscillibacter sp. 1-3]